MGSFVGQLGGRGRGERGGLGEGRGARGRARGGHGEAESGREWVLEERGTRSREDGLDGRRLELELGGVRRERCSVSGRW